MSEFRDTLKRLFSRNVVITRMPGDRLKVYDVNKNQTTDPASTQNYRTRWRNGRNFNSVSGYGSGYTNYEIEALRKTMYLDYELMDTDAIISSALDILADEATSNSATGELLVIKTDDEKIKKILHNLFYDILNVEFNLWSWVRTTCKYGDSFLYLQVVEDHGVINVIPIHPSLMIREEGSDADPSSPVFKYEGDGQFYSQANKFEQFEIAHFRLITDANFLPYGKSTIENARKEYKKLSLAEEAMLLHRIMRAPERRIYKIDIGNIPPNEVDAHMEQVIGEMKKTPYINPNTGEYNLQYNLQNSQEDFYLPVRGGDSGTTIETLPGLGNDGQLEDIEYLRTKMMAALKIPKAYLGYDGEGTRSGLSTEDVRFARMVERIQKIVVSELYKIAMVHLKVQGYDNKDLMNFELSLTSPSLIYERQKIDLLNEKFNLITNMLETNLVSEIYIYEVVLGMTENDWKLEKERIPNFLKEKFRYQQITDEGNDPKVTGRTYGTPHDIASMQVASKFDATEKSSLEKLYSPDERENNEGQPFKYKSFNTAKDKEYGRNPFGERDIEKQSKTARREGFLDALNKKYDSTKQSLTETKINDEPDMLNENRILNEE